VGSVRVDSQGLVTVLTSTKSDDIPTTPAGTRKRAGLEDYYLARLSPDGSRLVYGTCLGGAGAEFLGTHSLDLDAEGNAFVSCFTTSQDFPTTPGAFQRDLKGAHDAFVAKFSPAGILVASTLLGGSGRELTEGIAVGLSGEVVLTGGTTSSDFPVTADAYQRALCGKRDGYLVTLSKDLSRVLYGTYLGGSDDDSARGAAVDAVGNLYFAGVTKSGDFPITEGATQRKLGGVADACMGKLAPRIRD
jgi:hypothetical protein